MKRNKIKGKRKSSAKKKVVMTLASLLVIGLILVGGYLFFNDLSLNTSLKEYSKDNTLSNWLTGATVGIEEVGIEEIILEDLTIQTEATSTTCGTISANLTLTANITNTTICFTINAHNVALDCNGYGIKGDGGATDYAVTNTGGYDNITIQDCSFVTWGNGIRLATSASIGDYFYNNTFIDATSGIYVEVNSQAVILNNTFKSSSDTYGIFFNNGDNSNVTNNTFEGDYSINAIVLASSSSNNNVWQNKFFAADGINDVGTGNTFCVDSTMGNFYNGSVEIAQVPAADCGPTPNGTVNVNQSLTAQQFSWAGGDANYTDLRTGVYNLYNAAGKNTVYLKENHNTSYGQSSNAVETVRNNIAINCMGFQFGDSAANSAKGGIVVNGEEGIKINNCTINNFDSGIYLNVNGVAAIYNNTFIAGGEPYGVMLNNGDNSNVTNNTFEGDYSINAIVLASSSSNNNVWQNKFFAADGINDVGTGNTFCVDSTMGNFYNGSVEIAQVPAADCGPTPNGTVNVNQSLTAQQFSWAGGDANYTDLRTGVYNLYNAAGKNTVYLKENHNTSYGQSSNAVETVRNNIAINCMGFQFGDSAANSAKGGIVVNGEEGIKINNCTINNFDSGIYLNGNGVAAIYNNTFIAGGEPYGVMLNNGDNSNVTNNTFEGDYSINAIVLASSSSNNNVWQNKFFAADG